MAATIGDIRAFAFTFVPSGWVECNGQELLVSRYPALFMEIGNTFGGDGSRTFAVPDLRGRAAMGGYAEAGHRSLGQPLGMETVTLAPEQMPYHDHTVHGQRGGTNLPQPRQGAYLSRLLAGTGTQFGNAFVPPPIHPVYMHADAIGEDEVAGHPHENRQPYLVVVYGIAANP